MRCKVLRNELPPAAASFAVTTVADQAADALRHKIPAGALPEGYRLRQDALAAELGISRIPVREASSS